MDYAVQGHPRAVSTVEYWEQQLSLKVDSIYIEVLIILVWLELCVGLYLSWLAACAVVSDRD